MQKASHYRKAAARARRLGKSLTSATDSETLENMARDYDDIAVDLESGAIDVVHPERMPQLQHPCDD